MPNDNNNIIDVMSNALFATLNAEKKGYEQYIEILRQLEGMRPLEFSYSDSDGRSRTLKVPPITLVPLTMLHIKRATFDFSLAVSNFNMSKDTGVPGLASTPKPTGDVGPITENGVPVCYNPTTYTLHEKGRDQVLTAEVIKMGQTTTSRRVISSKTKITTSILKTYDYFVIIDKKYYVPKIVKPNSLPDTYITSNYLLNSKTVNLKEGYRLVYVQVDCSDLSVPEKKVNFKFYNDGKYEDADGNRYVPTPEGQLTTFRYDKTVDESWIVRCKFEAYYLSEAQVALNKNSLQVKSESKKNGNLNITVKMGQANISSGIISLLNAKSTK